MKNKAAIFIFLSFMGLFSAGYIHADVACSSNSFSGPLPAGSTSHGWRSLGAASGNIVALGFKATAQRDLHIGLQYGPRNWLEIVVGGWDNGHSAIRTVTGDSTAVDFSITGEFNIYANQTAGTAVSNAYDTRDSSLSVFTQGTAVIPGNGSNVSYLLYVAPEVGTNNGILYLWALSGTGGNMTTVLACKAPFLKQLFTHYSFHAWNSLVRLPNPLYSISIIGAGAVPLAAKGWGDGWLMSPAGDASLTLDANGLLRMQQGRDANAPFTVWFDETGNRIGLVSRATSRCAIAPFLPLIAAASAITGRSLATSDAARIACSTPFLDVADPSLWFVLDGPAAGPFKLKNVMPGGSPAYCTVGADSFVRAYGPSPTNASVYVVPNPVAQGSSFVFVPVSPQLPVNIRDVVTIQLADGSYWSVDPATNSIVARQTSPLDPSTHFTVDALTQGLGAISLGFNQGVVATDDSKNPSQLIAGPRTLPQGYAGFAALYNSATRTFSIGYRGGKIQQNSSNPSGPLQLVAGALNASNQFTFSAPLSAQQRVLEGLAIPSAPTVASVASDFTNKFIPAFGYTSNTAADWRFLVAALSSYCSAVVSMSGWTAPGLANQTNRNQSLRDVAVAMFTSAVGSSTIPADVKASAQAMIASLNDMPVFLQDPTTPPRALNLNSGDVIMLSMGNGTFLTHSGGTLSSGPLTQLGPQAYFTVVDYNKTTGRICLGCESQFVRLSQDGTNLTLTGTRRYVDVIVDSNSTQGFSFGYAGSPVTFASPKLGITGVAPVQRFNAVPLPPSFIAMTNMPATPAQMTSAQAVSALMVIDNAYLSLASQASDSVNGGDPTMIGAYAAAYIQQALTLPDWSTATVSVPAIGQRGSISGSLAGYAYMIIQEILTFGARLSPQVTQALTSLVATLVPMTTGQTVTFSLPDGRYLAVDAASGLIVPAQTSAMDPATHFGVIRYAPDSLGCAFSYGTRVIASDDSASPTRLRLADSSQTAAFTAAYSPTTKAFSFGFRGGRVQVSPQNPMGPVIVASTNGVDASKYTFAVNVIPAASLRLFDSLTTISSLTLSGAVRDLSGAFATAFAQSGKNSADWSFLYGLFAPYITAASALPGWTTPAALGSQGQASQSPRDRAVQLLQGALNDGTFPANLKANVQDLIAAQNDIPTYLADPTAPPQPLPVNVGDTVALGVAAASYLTKTTQGSVASATTGCFDPVAQFVVRDYNKATGRICLALSPTAFLRLSQNATSFVVTGTKRFIDIVRDTTSANKFAFSYAGAMATLSIPSATGGAATSVQNFTVVPVSQNGVQFGNLVGAASSASQGQDAIVAALQVIDALCAEQVTNNAVAPLSSNDWQYFATSVVAYLQRAMNAPSWAGPAISIPATPTQQAATMTLADYAAAIVARMINSLQSIQTASTARTTLLGATSLFSSLVAGSVVTFGFADGSYLGLNPTSGSLLPLQTSALNSAVQFRVQTYSKSVGTMTLQVGSLPVALDTTVSPNQLVAKTGVSPTSFQVVVDPMTKKMALGYQGATVQKNAAAPAGPVVLGSVATVDTSSYMFTVAGLQNNSGNTIQESSGQISLTQAISDIKNQYTSAFNRSGNTAADWQYLVNALTAYVAQASLISGWTAPLAAGSRQSLRDLAVGLFQKAVASPTVAAVDSAAAQAQIAQLNDMPAFLADPTTPPPSLSLSVGDEVVLSPSEGLYLSHMPSGAPGVVATHLLDPAAHFFVRDYNKTTGRICLGFDTSYVRLSADGTSLTITGTKRFVDIACDAARPGVFTFSYLGAPVALSSTSLGLTQTGAPASLTAFTATGPLSSAQAVFDGLTPQGVALTAASIQSDIQSRFDPAYAALGTIQGDWAFFVKTFVNYLARAASDVPSSSSLSITSAQAGTLTLKDYAIGVLSAMSGQFSPAPNDVQQVARTAVAQLRGGQIVAAATSGTSSTLGSGSTIFIRMPSSDLSSTQALMVKADGALQIVAGRAQCIPRAHITLGAYDSAAKTLKLSFGGKFFVASTGTFSAPSSDAATLLTMEPVRVGNATYYYLNTGGSSQRLSIAGSQSVSVSLSATGTIFDIGVVGAADCGLDALGVPASVQDVGQALLAYSRAFDTSATDGMALTILVDLFTSYCTNAASIAGWNTAGSASQLSGASPRDYAYSLLSNLTTSPAYSGVTQALEKTISDFLATGAPFASPPASSGGDVSVSSSNQQPAYALLDPRQGVFANDLPVFDSALRSAHDSTADLTSVLSAVSSYLAVAVTRADWITPGSSGTSSAKDFMVGALRRVADASNSWYFTGLTDELAAQVAALISKASSTDAVYSAQIGQLDARAAQLTDPKNLTASNQFVSTLNSLVALSLQNGTAAQRSGLISKIDTYFDGAVVPALKTATDGQVAMWSSLMFGVEASILQFAATTTDLLDEKMGYLSGVYKRRLSMIDQAAQPSILTAFLDPYLKQCASEFAVLVRATPVSTDARSQAMQTFLNFLDGLIKQLNAARQDLQLDGAVLTALANTMRTIWVATGLKPSAYAPATGNNASAGVGTSNASVATSLMSGGLLAPRGLGNANVPQGITSSGGQSVPVSSGALIVGKGQSQLAI